MICIKNIYKFFDNVNILNNINLNVKKGECLILLGESGSGKTTLLKIINRLIEPTKGSVFLENVNTQDMFLEELRRNIGYCFQEVGLFPHMNVFENIAVTPKLLYWDKVKIKERVKELLDMMELEPQKYMNRMPDELSGGQKQRIGVARALAAEPNVILFDEPFSALDPIVRESLQHVLIDIQKKMKITTVFVTHDIFEAILLGSRIAVINGGNLIQVGNVKELMQNPVNDYVQKIMSTPQRHSKIIEKKIQLF